MKEAINQSYFNLVAKTVESCFLKTKGKEAINECPSCGHPQAYFEVKK